MPYILGGEAQGTRLLAFSHLMMIIRFDLELSHKHMSNLLEPVTVRLLQHLKTYQFLR